MSLKKTPQKQAFCHGRPYRGRLAPTPTGYLHLGHARTFWVAAERARSARGTLVMRNEDLDHSRCRREFADAMFKDLRWFGLAWEEGPDVGGPFGPYDQSARISHYFRMWRKLRDAGAVYPSPHSRKDVDRALAAPHEGDVEAIFPVALRPGIKVGRNSEDPGGVNWRFRVPDGQKVEFIDGNYSRICRTAGVDFGDFIVWRKDGFPSYELAAVADDHAMSISEVVRGADLLTSTARQILLYRCIHWDVPDFFHCPLLRDNDGVRLAKRADALSLRRLRQSGFTPSHLRSTW